MGKQITAAEATQLCDNFDAKNKNLVKKDDNRSCLFTMQEIKEYIKYLEQNDNVDGIRIYFGTYDNNGKNTVFLAPTANGVDQKQLNAYNFGLAGNPPSKKYGK